MEVIYNKRSIILLVFTMLIMSISIFANSEEIDKDLMRKIERAFRISWELDEKIVQNLTFKLAKKQPLIGTGEKYFLLDNDNNIWMFKLPMDTLSSKIEEAVSKWGKLCGLNISLVHRINLRFNEEEVSGTIQRMFSNVMDIDGETISKHQVEKSGLSWRYVSRELIRNNWAYMKSEEEVSLNRDIEKDFNDMLEIFGSNFYKILPIIQNSLNFDCNDLKSYQTDELQRQQVLDYFIDNYDIGGFLIHVKSGEIYGVDKDQSFHAFRKGKKQGHLKDIMAHFEDCIYSCLGWPYIKKRANEDIHAGLVLAKFMSSIDDRLISEIFYPIFDEQIPTTFNIKTELIDRKNNLFEEFVSFYATMEQKQKQVFRIPGESDIIQYKKQVLKRLEKEIKEKTNVLKKLGNNKKHEQRNIDVISSHKAWIFLSREVFSHIIEEEIPREIKWQTVINGLNRLRDNSNSMAERLGITIYILQIHEFLLDGYPNSDKMNYFSNKRVTLHPGSMNIDSRTRRYTLIMKKNTSQDIESEFYYCMLLVYKLKGQYKKANEYLSQLLRMKGKKRL